MDTDFEIPTMMEKTMKMPKKEVEEKNEEELDFSDFDLRESV